MRRTVASAVMAMVALAWASCGRSDPPADAPARTDAASDPHRENGPRGFRIWHADFPLEVHLSPPVSGRYYDFTPTRALERIAAKLQGNCTREGWLAAKEFFRRAPPEAVEILVETMDRAFQAPELADLVENTVQAMGTMTHLRGPELVAALGRALEHPKESVREAAMRALETVGDAAIVRSALPRLRAMTLRSQVAWLRAARAWLGDEVVDVFGRLLDDREMAFLSGKVIEETLKLPPQQAVRILGPRWERLPSELRPAAAGILHAQGDYRGTGYLQGLLRGGDPRAQALAIGLAARGDLSKLQDDVLRLSESPSAAVRQAVVLAVQDRPGENVGDLLEVLAMDPAAEVRQPALRALLARGRREQIDALIERVRTGTGTMLRQAVTDLAAIGDPRAIPVIAERFRDAPAGEARMYLQALGLSRRAEAFAPMREIFLGPERVVDTAGRLTTVTYTAELFPNLEPAYGRIADLFEELPRTDYRRRALLLRAMGNAAAFTQDEVFARRVYDLYRRLAVDATEIPQMRLLALTYLRKDLRLADMKRLSRLQHEEKDGAMRKAITGYLFEFF